jgi:predicted dehydrogenase
MSEVKLKTALLGLNEQGQNLLKVASQIKYFDIRAVADNNITLAEKTAKQYDSTAYDDYRQLIVQNQFDCLLVASPTHTCDEHICTAIKKKFKILKLAPAARNFDEAVRFTQLAQNNNTVFAVATPMRFAQSFIRVRELLQQNQIEHVFLITAAYACYDPVYPAWYTDPTLAGGGVLLHDCYHLFDQILWNLSIPQQVYSLNTNQACDKQQRLYRTEDTAIVTMKFNDTLIGNLTACQHVTAGVKEESLKIYGKDKTIKASINRLTVTDGSGQIIEQRQYDDDTASCIKKLLQNFALSILSPDNNLLCSSFKENLNVLAVIESAYLSARTGCPEEPGRILQRASQKISKTTNI